MGRCDMILNASKIRLDGIYAHEKGISPKGRYEVPTAERDVEYIEIRGREGPLTKKYGYKNIPLTVKFYIHSEGFKKTFRKVKPFILNAKTFQVDDDDEVYYKIKSVNILPSENMMKTFGEFEVEFIFSPHQYETNNNPIILTSSKTIQNDGYKCLPIITATVAGTGNIYIGDQQITVKDVNGTITIDSEMKNAYRKGSPPQNMNKHMIGKFPVFENGNSAVSFDGDISKLEIVMNRRWV